MWLGMYYAETHCSGQFWRAEWRGRRFQEDREQWCWTGWRTKIAAINKWKRRRRTEKNGTIAIPDLPEQAENQSRKRMLYKVLQPSPVYSLVLPSIGSLPITQLVKTLTLWQRVHSSMTCRSEFNSRRDTRNTVFHPFEVGKRVATMTNGGWRFLEHCGSRSGTEAF